MVAIPAISHCSKTTSRDEGRLLVRWDHMLGFAKTMLVESSKVDSPARTTIWLSDHLHSSLSSCRDTRQHRLNHTQNRSRSHAFIGSTFSSTGMNGRDSGLLGDIECVGYPHGAISVSANEAALSVGA